MILLEARDLTVSVAGGVPILDRVSLSLRSGECMGLLGPNGAGKSTLLRALAHVRPASTGAVSIDGRALEWVPRVERARLVGYLPQEPQCYWSLVSEQVVALGRLPYRQGWEGLDRADWAVVERVMAQTDTLCFAGRPIDTLSVGERARVLLARALAGEPRILLADEPVAGLDPAHQLEVMELLRRLAGAGMAVVAVLHDLTLAARYCPRLVLLHRGRLVAEGSFDKVLNADHLRECFRIRAHRSDAPEGPIVVPVEKLVDTDSV